MALEALPAELRILILQSVPDAQTLHSLIIASQLYHDTYHVSRSRILHEIAQRQLGLFDLIEPLTAIRSLGLYAEVESEKPAIIDLLHGRSTSHEVTRLLFPEQSIGLLGLGRKLDAVLQAFCAHAPCPPERDPGVWQQQLPLRPSHVERARLMRALCRLQTYCNLFGDREWVDSPSQLTSPVRLLSTTKQQSSTWHRNFTVNEMWNLMFAAIPPWEVEEFGSVCAFVRNEYMRIFAEMQQQGFSRTNPRWRALRSALNVVDPSDLYPSEDDNPEDFSIYLNHLVSLGPSFLYKVLSQVTQEDRWRLVATNSVSGKSSFSDTMAAIRQPSNQWCSAAAEYGQDNILAAFDNLPLLEQPNSRWKQHWYGHASTADTMLLNQPGVSYSPLSVGPEQQSIRTFGYFNGWEFGYALWDN